MQQPHLDGSQTAAQALGKKASFVEYFYASNGKHQGRPPASITIQSAAHMEAFTGFLSCK